MARGDLPLVFLEYVLNDESFSSIESQVSSYALSMFIERLDNIVPVRATSSRLPLQDPSFKTTMSFLGEVFQEERIHGALKADVEFTDCTF